MRWARSGWMRNLAGDPKARGFLWGAGTVATAYFLWPAVREAIRPATKGMVRGAMAAGDRFRYAWAGAREGLEDVIAEAQFERIRDYAEPDPMAIDEPPPESAVPKNGTKKTEH